MRCRLSSWLRDCLYIPLGGSRKGAVRTYVDLFATMLLGGRWHGASWNFVIWGSPHGLWLRIERFWTRARPAGLPMVPGWLAGLVTLHAVVLGWIFFRAPDLDAATGYLGALADGRWNNTPVTPLPLALVAFGMAIHVTPSTLSPAPADRLRRRPAMPPGLAFGALVLIVDAMQPEGVAPFIYYQFYGERR